MLLFGDRFAGGGGFLGGSEELLTGAGAVAQDELAAAVLTVALLAMEQAGEIRLVHQRQKALLGLRTREVVVAEPTGSRAAWPAGSVEGELREALKGARAPVADVVHRWFGTDMRSPGRHLLERVRRGLVARGLVQPQETRTDLLPDATRAMLEGESPQPLLDLLAAPGERGVLCSLLRTQVAGALGRRTESREN